MKLVVVGIGQCGGRVADEFARMQMRARGLRGIDIILEIIAVNTDATDLAGITSIKPDVHHRMLVGTRETRGHGTARVSELGAEIMHAETPRVMEAIKRNNRVY